MGLTILLVDDDPVARRTIQMLFGRDPALTALDARIVHAVDGRQALELFPGARPDLVICDLLMPRMDGFALARALRARPDGRRVPLLLISGVYRDEAVIDRFCAEVNGRFLAKPVSTASLAQTVSHLLGEAPSDGVGGSAQPVRRRTITATAGGPSRPRPAAAAARGDEARGTPAEESARLAREGAPSAQGSLADKGLPRLLFDLMDAGLTGTLVLKRGRMRKEIFLVGGQAVGADSNLRQEALGAYLVDRGVIDDARHQHLLAEAQARKQRLGSTIISLGWMSEADVINHLIGQARMRIMTSLRWTDGEWSFFPGEAYGLGELAHSLDAERTILTGLMRSATLEAMTARLFLHTGSRLRLSPRGERFRADFEAVFGPQILADILEAPSVGSLYPRADVELILSAVEALVMTGFVETQARSLTVRTPAPVPVPARPDTLEALDAADVGAAPDSAFDDAEESGVVPLAALKNALRDDGRRALLREYLQMHDRSYYQLLGVTPEADVESIRKAYAEASGRWSTGAFKTLDLGPDGAKADEVRAIYERAYQVLTTPELRREYDSRLAGPAKPSQAVDAELAFLDGVACLEAGKPEEAIARFEAAVAARPDQAAYHAYVGWSRLLAGDDLAESGGGGRAALRTALEIDPDLALAHEFLGRAAADAGERDLALEHLDRSLQIDPTRMTAFEALVHLFAATGENAELERLYRRVLHRVGDRDPELRKRLWTELGDLFAQRLADPISAKIAYGAAMRLAPDDVALAHRLAAIGGVEGAGWRDTARVLLAEWRANPDDAKRGHSLIERFLSASGNQEAGHVAAGALFLMGLASPEVISMVEARRPTALPRIAKPLDRRTLARLRHPDEDDDLEEMIGILAAEGVIDAIAADPLASGDATLLLAGAAPEIFGRVSVYVSTVLGTKLPPIYVVPSLPNGSQMADVNPPVLLVGRELLVSDDRIELAFRLGRSLAMASLGRIAGGMRTGRLLRPYLLAVLNLAGRPAEDDPEVSTVRAQLETLPPPAVVRLRELGDRLQSERKSVNLSRFARALRATASRIGLLLSGDLVRVGEAIGNEEGPKAVEALIDFAVSASYADLRAELAGDDTSGSDG